MMNLSLAVRMKRYELTSRHYLTKRMPVIIRVDGKSFHTLTKKMKRPFDLNLINAMINAAKDTAKEMQGFKAAYVQSDEVTFCLTDYETITTQGWFDYNHSKLVSISAAYMTYYFRKYISFDKPAVFDSRAFNVPMNDVVNNFLWRAKDWERNSLQMYARSIFSHKELHKKKRWDIHEMLFGKGKNWAKDLENKLLNGTFILNSKEDGLIMRHDIKPNYDEINDIIWPLIQQGE